MNIRQQLLISAWMLSLISPVFAHHSLAGYDQSVVATLKGTIRAIQWRNPHTQMTLEIKNPDGTVTSLQIEMAGPSALVRKGFEQNFVKPGATVTFEALRPANGQTTSMFNARTLALADGRRFDVSDPWGDMTVRTLPDPTR